MRKILVVTLLALVLVLDVVAVHRLMTLRTDRILDFLRVWHGTQAMLFEKEDPYGPVVTNRIQMAILGRPAKPGACQQVFLYPAFTGFTIPHMLMPYPLGNSLWIVTQQVLLVGIVFLVIASTSQTDRMSPAYLVMLTLAAATYRYSLLNIGYSQFSLYVLFWFALTWCLWHQERYLAAGLALAPATIKPHLTFLIVPLWLLLAVAHRRWRFVVAFGLAMIVLLTIPVPFAGNWYSGFIHAAQDAARTCQKPIYDGTGLPLRLGATVLLCVALLAVWFRALRDRSQQSQSLGYLLSLSIAVTLLAAPYVRSYDLVLVLVPLLHVLIVLRRRQGTAARVLKALTWGVLVILPWILWGLAPKHNPESIERWLIPLVSLVLLAALPAVLKGQPAQVEDHPVQEN